MKRLKKRIIAIGLAAMMAFGGAAAVPGMVFAEETAVQEDISDVQKADPEEEAVTEQSGEKTTASETDDGVAGTITAEPDSGETPEKVTIESEDSEPTLVDFGDCGQYASWKINWDAEQSDKYELVISGTDYMQDYSNTNDIPWYDYHDSIVRITIEDGVSSIGANAFCNSSSLTSVTIPDSVTGIDSYAFYNCSSLTSVTIPDSVTWINYNAFGKCSSLKSVVIGNNVTNIGKWAFSGCSSLSSVTFPDSPVGISMDDSVFENCTGLESISLPDSVTSMGDYLFSGCTGLTSVRIPENGGTPLDLFTGCTSLKDIYYGGDEESWNDFSWFLSFPDPKPVIHYNCKAGSDSADKLVAPVFFAKPANGGFRVTWNKAAGTFTGYQIQYSTDKGFGTNTKTVTIKNPETVSKSVAYVQTKNPYYVRIRTYRTAEGKNTYSEWSSAKIVKAGVYQKKAKLSGLQGGKKGSSYTATLSDSYFMKDSTKVQKGLAMLTAQLALSTYTGSATRKLLETYGFSDAQTYFSKSGMAHSTETDNDHGIVYLGYKKIANDSGTGYLVAVVISGYSSGNYEWISNFNLGKEGQYHAGFKKAAKEITAKVKSYLKARGLTGKNLNFVMTGHSRGAALTNLVAKSLTGTYGKKNVYAYGYATPRSYTGTKSQRSTMKTKYNNIINYVSDEDFVPTVAPQDWGYCQIGQVKTFSSSKKAKMKSYFKAYSGGKYEGYTVKQRKTITSLFTKFGRSQKQYYSRAGNGTFTPAKYAKKGLGRALTKSTKTRALGVAVMTRCAKSSPVASALTAQLVTDGVITKRVDHSHKMLTYLCWMRATYG